MLRTFYHYRLTKKKKKKPKPNKNLASIHTFLILVSSFIACLFPGSNFRTASKSARKLKTKKPDNK